MIFSPALVDLFAPGYHAIPGKWELSVSLVRIMFPFLLLVALAAQAQGILFACHRYAIPSIAPAVYNVCSVAFGLALGYLAGPRLGIDPGACNGVRRDGRRRGAALVFNYPPSGVSDFAWRPRWNTRHEGVRHILGLMGPALIGNASGQINVLVNTNFAAGLRDASGHVMNGPVSWLAYAYRFFALPMGVFGISVAAAALPHLSRSAAHRKFVRVPRDALALDRDDPAVDHPRRGRTCDAGRKYDRHRVSTWKISRVRYSPDGSRAFLLRGGTGGLFH